MRERLIDLEDKLFKMTLRRFKSSKLFNEEYNRKYFISWKQNLKTIPLYFVFEYFFENNNIDSDISNLYKEYIELKLKYKLNIEVTFDLNDFKKHLEGCSLYHYIVTKTKIETDNYPILKDILSFNIK